MADRSGFPVTNLTEYTVSELSFAIKRTVEDAYGRVRLRGEISGFRGRHSSGHCYFVLKDEKATIEAVIWRGAFAKLKFKPEEGLEIVATGRVSTYPDRSKYQIIIEQIEPAGMGALMALLEQRKKQLAAEGLFAEALKKPLPYLPRIVGVVTSPTGAVIRDILHRLEDRFPSHVLVWPVRVQGETCAAEVAAGIAGFNAFVLDGPMPRPDLIIVARGGGSLEDLWGFNEEVVARAAHASVIPLISAVGHETDWTIIDFVADWRAPTPSAAAERAVPVRAELTISVRSLGVRAGRSLRRLFDGQRTRLQATSRGLLRKRDILGLPRQRLDTLSARLPRALTANARIHHTGLSRCASRLRPHLVVGVARLGRDRLARLERARRRAGLNMVAQARGRFDNQAKLLSTLSYQNVLARGFTLVRDAQGRMLRRAGEVKADACLDIQFADGHVPVTADADGQPMSAPQTRSRKHKPKEKPKDKPKHKQGTLQTDPIVAL